MNKLSPNMSENALALPLSSNDSFVGCIKVDNLQNFKIFVPLSCSIYSCYCHSDYSADILFYSTLKHLGSSVLVL